MPRIKDINNKLKLQFKFLPGFADYLLKNKIREFTENQLDLMFKVDFPILKYYDLSIYTKEQLIDLSVPSYVEFLTAMLQNKLSEFIDEALKKWETNQLPNITRDQLVVEDITLASYIRKKALLTFIPFYTSDVTEAIELLQEIEDYTLEVMSKAFSTYINIYNEKVNTINETLKKHESDLLEAQEIASFGSFDWDLSGSKSSYTPQVFKIFEMEKPDESLAKFLDYVHPGDREKLQASIDSALKGEREFECEYRYRRNGKEKIIWSKGILSFKDNKPTFMKGTIMDITDRHYMLQRLKRNEELYKQAQKLTHIGNWTWDLQTNEVNFSDELYRIYGLELNEKITFNCFISFIHPDDKEKVSELIDYSLNTKQPHSIDFKIIRKDGDIRIIRRNAEVLLDEKGNPYKIAGAGQDITKEILLNREIKEREENFSQLIQNAPDAIIVSDEHSKIILWNPKATEIFGWLDKDVINLDLTNTIIPKRYHDDYKSSLLVAGNPNLLNKTIEIIASNKQKKEFYISLTISESVQNGKPVFISFIRDISFEKNIKSELKLKTNELAELNLSLKQKNIELERSNKELTSFSYVASHDLQEPLRKIKTFTNLILERESNLSTEGKQRFERIIASTGRMQKLIEDLLSFSRTDLKENTISEIDLNVVITDVKNLYQEAIKDGNLAINSDPLPIINGIQFQIQQLFENIISNSIKYSKPKVKTEITITIKSVNDKDLGVFNPEKNKKYYNISITDNGIGFEQQYSEKIFEIFQRLHGKSEYSGTGIGLSICKKIVENHHGFIRAKSKINEGSTFDIYLPLTVN